MGYYTTFNLNKIKGSDADYDALVADIKEKTGVDLEFGDNVKWYDYEQDMTEASKKYPDLVVELCGDGEDSDDHWSARFACGQVEYDKDGYFVRLASTKERKNFVRVTSEKAKTYFILTIEAVIGGGEMSVDITLQDDGLQSLKVNQISVEKRGDEVFTDVTLLREDGHRQTVDASTLTLDQLRAIAEAVLQ